MSRTLKYGAVAAIGFVAGTVYGQVKQAQFEQEQNEIKEQMPDEIWEELPEHVKHIAREHPEAIEFHEMPIHGNPFGGGLPFDDDDEEYGGTNIDLD